MNEEQQELITNLVLNRITVKDFNDQYPESLLNEPNYILDQLQEAYKNQDGSQLESTIMLLFYYEAFSQKYTEILSKAVVEDWHTKHEDIAIILKKIKDPKSVDFLYNAATIAHKYLDYDDNKELARKCISALGAIKSDGALEKLAILSQSGNETIKRYAEKELKRKSN